MTSPGPARNSRKIPNNGATIFAEGVSLSISDESRSLADPDRPAGEEFDVGTAIDNGEWGLIAKMTLTFGALAVILDGFDIQLLGFSIGLMSQDFGVARGDFSFVLALGYFGIGIGTATGGLAGDRFGRKNTLLIAVGLFGVFTALTALAPGLGLVAFCRTVAGVGLGMVFPVVAALVAEVTPIRRRGLAVALAMVCVPVGAMIGGVVAALLLPTMGWRFLFVLGGVAPIVLGLAMTLAMPESPQFQVARGTDRHRARAIATLERMGHAVGSSTVLVNRNGDLPRASVGVLVGKQYRRDSYGLWIAFFFSLLGMYAFLSWGPTVLVAAGFDIATSSLSVSAFHLGGIIFAVGGGWLMVRRGSKVVLTTYAVGIAVIGLWLLLAQPSPQGSLTVVFVQLFLYGGCLAGLQVLLYSLAALVYPVAIKARGVGVAGLVGRAGAIVAAFVGASLVAAGGGWYYAMVIVVGVMGALALAVIRNHTRPVARGARLEPAVA
jgi:MFS transporter, AAHS family, 4-hydroxybenzoate transporter